MNRKVSSIVPRVSPGNPIIKYAIVRIFCCFIIWCAFRSFCTVVCLFMVLNSWSLPDSKPIITALQPLFFMSTAVSSSIWSARTKENQKGGRPVSISICKKVLNVFTGRLRVSSVKLIMETWGVFIKSITSCRITERGSFWNRSSLFLTAQKEQLYGQDTEVLMAATDGSECRKCP